MATVAPFRGIHFDPLRVDLARSISPPYDVISQAEAARLRAASPANIVRLILPDQDIGGYERAAQFLRNCLTAGEMLQDPAPSLYAYQQRFVHPTLPDRRMTRLTLFVALRLEPYSSGIVLPHEETHPKAKADRLELMRASGANPEPIYGLYEDPGRELASSLSAAAGEPLLEAETDDGQVHTIHRYDNAELVHRICAFFQDRGIWIADGHHRYETALNYQKERNLSGEHGNKPYDFILIGLTAFEDPGIVVLATHRLVRNIPAPRMEQLTLSLQRYFEVRVMPTARARQWLRERVPGETRIVTARKDSSLALQLRSYDAVAAAVEAGHSPAWVHLDVTVLQSLVLDRTLGISWAELAHTPNVVYTRDEEEALDKVACGEFQLACLLQDPEVAEVREVAQAGDRMPQKSTFFYPKLWSGLILRSVQDQAL
ncbi:MAG TPA: DUF1015 domain-containing protein [Chthonomonadales bacterium]|nr:DUF1015 domain-containing protein [Chthonomonadales bacterium]